MRGGRWTEWPGARFSRHGHGQLARNDPLMWTLLPNENAPAAGRGAAPLLLPVDALQPASRQPIRALPCCCPAAEGAHW